MLILAIVGGSLIWGLKIWALSSWKKAQDDVQQFRENEEALSRDFSQLWDTD